ncbi:MAG TPA: endonuclease domain-containing protein [Rhizomicrobium sp.]|nr:endonuclease domain-containing protein [Rhizomicrobium sp.]
MRNSPRADVERRRALKRGAARKLRDEATETERKMWSLLRRRQLQELRFRRQQPIGPYIVDFFCPAAKLIVELDGGQHGEDEAVIYDLARTEWLEAQGYRVLRFWNLDFLKNPEVVLEGIWRAILESGTPLPEALRAPLPEALRASTLPQGEG